jgi:AbrB family looped-hinge helix DNA binding protein
MPIVLKRRIVKIGNSLRVTIPTEICELLKLNPKDTLEFTATNGDIIIRKGKS